MSEQTQEQVKELSKDEKVALVISNSKFPETLSKAFSKLSNADLDALIKAQEKRKASAEADDKEGEVSERVQERLNKQELVKFKQALKTKISELLDLLK